MAYDHPLLVETTNALWAACKAAVSALHDMRPDVEEGERQTAFMRAAQILAVYVADGDGVLSREEVNTINNVF